MVAAALSAAKLRLRTIEPAIAEMDRIGAASDALRLGAATTLLRASRPDTRVQATSGSAHSRLIHGTTSGASNVSAITITIGVNIASGTTPSPVDGRMSVSITIAPPMNSSPKTTRTGPIRGGSNAASRSASIGPTRPARRAADRAPSIATRSPAPTAMDNGTHGDAGSSLTGASSVYDAFRKQQRCRQLGQDRARERRRQRDDQRLAENHPPDLSRCRADQPQQPELTSPGRHREGERTRDDEDRDEPADHTDQTEYRLQPGHVGVGHRHADLPGRSVVTAECGHDDLRRGRPVVGDRGGRGCRRQTEQEHADGECHERTGVQGPMAADGLPAEIEHHRSRSLMAAAIWAGVPRSR